MYDWKAFSLRLREHPGFFHRLLPPCQKEQIESFGRKLGSLPDTLKEMLSNFNGAELFISGSPLVSFFRISSTPPLPPLEWAPEWCIDSITREWRDAGDNRNGVWAIAMTNYGGLILLDADEFISEWDTGEGRWVLEKQSLEQWIEKLICEGEKVMAE